MTHPKRAKVLRTVGALFIAGALVPWAVAPATAGGNHGGGNGKVEICHATGSSSNPYTQIKVSVSSLKGSSGHHKHLGDIIPPVPGYVPHGLNWNTTGKVTYYNDCKVPRSTPTPTPTVTVTETKPPVTVTATATHTKKVTKTATATVTATHTKKVTKTATATVTATETEQVPGPTVTVTETETEQVPGPTVTVTETETEQVPGPTTTVTEQVPGPETTVTETVPGPETTVTETVPGPETTVTETEQIPGPETTATATETQNVTATAIVSQTDSMQPQDTEVAVLGTQIPGDDLGAPAAPGGGAGGPAAAGPGGAPAALADTGAGGLTTQLGLSAALLMLGLVLVAAPELLGSVRTATARRH